MNLKTRFVILLTLLIGIILVISFGVLYALYSGYLYDDAAANVSERIRTLRIIVLAVIAMAGVLAVFVSLFFIREVFMPVKKLGDQMQQITIRNISARLPVNKSRDEISQVARNFNDVLDRMNAAFDFQKNFVFHASHEFRTPLAIMFSETESALSKELSAEEYKNVLVSLKEEQQELIELTNSLLLISQSDDMEYVQEWPMLRIDEILYDTISHAKKMFPGLAIEMLFGELPNDPEDLVVQGNASLLNSSFINLIKNAYMYSVDQKVAITLETSGNTILIHFDNMGTQLPADEKESIMVPFYRGNNALKTKGYGLGLPIVNRFISIHKGSIAYTPVSNHINRFTISLVKANMQGAENKKPT